jgi:hypothetical protein
MDVVNVESVLDNKQISIVIEIFDSFNFIVSDLLFFIGHMKKHIINLSRNGE